MTSSGSLINEKRLFTVTKEMTEAMVRVIQKYDLSDADMELVWTTMQREYISGWISKTFAEEYAILNRKVQK